MESHEAEASRLPSEDGRRIGVEPGPGAGSTFAVELPIVPAREATG